MIFESSAVELFVTVCGMVRFRILNLWDIKITKAIDYPPNDMGVKKEASYDYYYDLGKQFELSFEDEEVVKVIVDGTNCYPFSFNDFDEEKADKSAQQNSLPDNIHFQLQNGVDFGIYTDGLEWFFIKLKNISTFA